MKSNESGTRWLKLGVKRLSLIVYQYQIIWQAESDKSVTDNVSYERAN